MNGPDRAGQLDPLHGSLVTFVYSATADLPAGSPEAALGSLTDAIAVADGNPAVLAAANAAYGNGYLVTIAVVAVVLALGAAVAARLLRRHGPGTPSALRSGGR